MLGAVTEAATKQEEGEEGDGSPPPSPDVLLNQFRSLVGLRGWPAGLACCWQWEWYYAECVVCNRELQGSMPSLVIIGLQCGSARTPLLPALPCIQVIERFIERVPPCTLPPPANLVGAHAGHTPCCSCCLTQDVCTALQAHQT